MDFEPYVMARPLWHEKRWYQKLLQSLNPMAAPLCYPLYNTIDYCVAGTGTLKA